MAAWQRVVERLGEPQYRDRMLQALRERQRDWLLFVVDPEELYDRDFGSILERARAKIEAVRSEREPAVAPTFAELETTAVRPAGD